MSFDRRSRRTLSIVHRGTVAIAALVLLAAAMATLSCSTDSSECNSPDVVVHYDCTPLDAGTGTPGCYGTLPFQGKYYPPPDYDARFPVGCNARPPGCANISCQCGRPLGDPDARPDWMCVQYL